MGNFAQRARGGVKNKHKSGAALHVETRAISERKMLSSRSFERASSLIIFHRDFTFA
jgi:hypothetical protein